MTRRKAIETACGMVWGHAEHVLIEPVAARAYDLGRAAGLLEGAKMAMCDGGWTPVIGGIKRKARALKRSLKQ